MCSTVQYSIGRFSWKGRPILYIIWYNIYNIPKKADDMYVVLKCNDYQVVQVIIIVLCGE